MHTAACPERSESSHVTMYRPHAQLETRSPAYFEDPTDQADAVPYVDDESIKLTNIVASNPAAKKVTNAPGDSA